MTFATLSLICQVSFSALALFIIGCAFGRFVWNYRSELRKRKRLRTLVR